MGSYLRKAFRFGPLRRDVWEGALKAERRVERRYGKKNLGPWDDFEWGMINIKDAFGSLRERLLMK